MSSCSVMVLLRMVEHVGFWSYQGSFSSSNSVGILKSINYLIMAFFQIIMSSLKRDNT